MKTFKNMWMLLLRFMHNTSNVDIYDHYWCSSNVSCSTLYSSFHQHFPLLLCMFHCRSIALYTNLTVGLFLPTLNTIPFCSVLFYFTLMMIFDLLRLSKAWIHIIFWSHRCDILVVFRCTPSLATQRKCLCLVISVFVIWGITSAKQRLWKSSWGIDEFWSKLLK